MLLVGQTVPGDVSPWASGGGLVILGYLCYLLIRRDADREAAYLARDAARDAVIKDVSESITQLRIHCLGQNRAAQADPHGAAL